MSVLAQTPITPNAFCTQLEAQGYALRDTTPTQSQANAIGAILSAVTGRIEALTGRRLKARNHTQAVTIAGGITLSVDAVTNAVYLYPPPGSNPGIMPGVREGDDVVQVQFTGGPALPGGYPNAVVPGSRVVLNRASVNNETAGCQIVGPTVTDYIIGTSDKSQLGMTFGSRRMLLPLTGHQVIVLPQWPLNTLFGAYTVDNTGTRNAIDLTGAYIDYEQGMIEVTTSLFTGGSWGTAYTLGDMRLEVEANCGYQQPTSYAIGHASAWYELSYLTQRMVEIAFTKLQTSAGTFDGVQAGAVSATVAKMNWPADVMDIINAYRREGR